MTTGIMTVGDLIEALQRLDNPSLMVWTTNRRDLTAPLRKVVVTTAGDVAQGTMEGDPSGPRVVVLTDNENYESAFQRWKARGWK